MAIPAAAASNASIWAARIWVPLPMLRVAAAAAGMLPASCGGCGLGSNSSSITSSSSGSGYMGCTCSVGVGGGACPELMCHIALELQRQLSDAAGAVNKQVATSRTTRWLPCFRRISNVLLHLGVGLLPCWHAWDALLALQILCVTLGSRQSAQQHIHAMPQSPCMMC